MNYVGVVSGISKVIYPTPKKESLVFDRIAFLGLQEYVDWLRDQTHQEYMIADELDWLKSEGILFEPTFAEVPTSQASKSREAFCSATKVLSEMLQRYYAAYGSRHENVYHFPTQGIDYHQLDKLLAAQLSIASLHARLACIWFRQNGHSATPLWGTISIQQQKSDLDFRKANILQIVMNRIPVPDENTPWEVILDFKNDLDSVGTLLGLRNWINNIARGELEISEIETNLDYLLYEYKRALQLHKIKYTRGIIETLVVTSAEILENLIKVKWGDLAKSLFSIGNRRVDLLEAEMNAVGREVSFIIKTQEQFGDV